MKMKKETRGRYYKSIIRNSRKGNILRIVYPAKLFFLNQAYIKIASVCRSKPTESQNEKIQ